MDSQADFWAMLMRTLPKNSVVNILPAEYNTPGNASKRFIVGIPFERLPLFAQGANQKGGDLLTVSIKNAGAANEISEVFIFAEYCAVMEIADSQISLYD